MPVQTFKELFNGSYHGVAPPTLLPPGGICDGLNIRRASSFGGWKPRKGCGLHNTTALGAAVLSLHQYEHPVKGDYHFIAQSNGNLYDATNDPPTGGTTFAASALSNLASSTVPGFSTTVGPYWIYADGDGAPVVWGGDYPTSIGFIISDNGVETDFTRLVSDARTDTYAQVANAYDQDCIYFNSMQIASGVKLTFDSSYLNSETATLTIYAWRSGSWTSVGTISDGTASGGATFAQDGTITWTAGADTMRVIRGMMGYWYKITWSANLTAGVRIRSCDVIFSPARMTNKWNGAHELPASVRFYDASATQYMDYTSKVSIQSTSVYMDLNQMQTDDFIYIKTIEPCCGFGFAIVDGGGNTADAQVDGLEVWTDSGWASPGGIIDETLDDAGDSSFAETGAIWFNAAAVTPRKRTMDFDSSPGYWYRISVDAALSDTDIYVFLMTAALFPEALPAYKGCIEFKGRLMLWGGPEYPNRLRYSSVIRPDCFSGRDSGYTAAFGDMSEIISCVRFYNELLVIKKDSVWLLEGYSPSTFGILKLADTIGTVAPKAICSVEAGSPAMKTEETLSIIAFVASDGLYLIDGRKPRKVSDPVDHYFNPEYSTCTEAAKLDDIQVFPDKSNNEIHILIPYSATQDAVELVYNYVLDEWYPPWKRRIGGANDYLSCGLQFYGTDNRIYTYGGTSGGFVSRLEYDTSDKDASNADVAIQHSVKTRAISLDQKMPTTLAFTFLKVVLEAAQCATTGTITTKFYKNLITTGTTLASPAAISLVSSGYSMTTDGLRTNQTNCSCFQLEFIANTVDLEMELWGLLYNVDVRGEIVL